MLATFERRAARSGDPVPERVLRDDAILEEENCILCGLCERYCPDLAMEMIPAALAAHAAKGGAEGGSVEGAAAAGDEGQA